MVARHRALDLLLMLFTGAGRARLRRLQDAETDALVVAHRIHLLRQLACMAEYQLGITDLARRQTIASQPGVEAWATAVVDSFSQAVTRHLDTYAHAQRGHAQRGVAR